MNLSKLVLIGCLIFATTNPSFGQVKWEPLHSKHDLNDFVKRNGTAEYSLEDGIITGISRLNTPNTFLATKTYYDDFILEFDVWIEDGLNSGVQFRSNTDSSYYNGAVFGYQAEIETSDRKWAGGIYDESRRGWLYPLSINSDCAQSFQKQEWNHYRIAAIGNHIMTWVNDVPCANIYDDLTSSGFIGLQVHSIGDSTQVGKEVKWKNLRICTSNLEKVISNFPNHNTSVSYLDNRLSEDEVLRGWHLLTTDSIAVHNFKFPINYDEFELEFDFKAKDGQTGTVFYHQYLEDSLIYVLSPIHNNTSSSIKVGSLKRRKTATNLSERGNDWIRYKGGDRWNKARIIKKSTSVQHWLNNILLVEYPLPASTKEEANTTRQFADFSFDHIPSIRSIKIRNLIE